MKPLVSVVIPTFNRAHTLERAINSVLAQTMNNLEVIVVDDGSTDQTAEVLKKFQYISVIQTENQGVSRARNKGIVAAKASWIAFLDSDDEWLPEKLAKQFREASLAPHIPLIHGEEIWIRNGVRVNPMKKHHKSGGDLFSKALELCCISPSTALVKKSLFNEVGFFREDFPVCEDYDLWLRVVAKYPVAFVSDYTIKKFGGHKDQLSRQYKAMDYWRILSLLSLLESNSLNSIQWKLTLQAIQKKSKILLKGFRKHQNLDQYDFIFEKLKQISSQQGRNEASQPVTSLKLH